MIKKDDLKVHIYCKAWLGKVLFIDHNFMRRICSIGSFLPIEHILRSVEMLTSDSGRYDIVEMSVVGPEVPKINYRAMK